VAEQILKVEVQIICEQSKQNSLFYADRTVTLTFKKFPTFRGGGGLNPLTFL